MFNQIALNLNFSFQCCWAHVDNCDYIFFKCRVWRKQTFYNKVKDFLLALHLQHNLKHEQIKSGRSRKKNCRRYFLFQLLAYVLRFVKRRCSVLSQIPLMCLLVKLCVSELIVSLGLRSSVCETFRFLSTISYHKRVFCCFFRRQFSNKWKLLFLAMAVWRRTFF